MHTNKDHSAVRDSRLYIEQHSRQGDISSTGLIFDLPLVLEDKGRGYHHDPR